MTHQPSHMWTPSLGMRYQSSLVLILGNNQYEAIAPLYLLLSNLPSSEMADRDTKSDGCTGMCVHACILCIMHVIIRLSEAEESCCGFCMLLLEWVTVHACISKQARWATVSWTIAVADGSGDTGRMQAVPMRPCMLTAAGHREQQLLMGFQYKEPTLCFAFISLVSTDTHLRAVNSTFFVLFLILPPTLPPSVSTI